MATKGMTKGQKATIYDDALTQVQKLGFVNLSQAVTALVDSGIVAPCQPADKVPA